MSFSLALPLILSLFHRISACSSVPNPVSGLFVDVAALAEGDGSECFPFLTLNRGLDAAGVVSVGKVVLVPRPGDAEIRGVVSIQSEVRIEGQDAGVVLTGQVQIGQIAQLSLFGLRLKQGTELPDALIQCDGGSLLIENTDVQGGIRGFIENLGGSIDIKNSQITGSVGSILILRSQNGQIRLSDVSIVDSEDLFEVQEDANGGEGLIALTAVEIIRSGKLLNYRWAAGGGLRMKFENSVVQSARKELVAGSIGNLIWETNNVTVLDSQQIVSGKVIDSTITFKNCTFMRINNRLFDLSALKGELTISNTTIIVVTQGPVILLPANTYPPSSALITVKDSLIANVTNFGYSGIGIVCVGLSVTFSLVDSEVKDSSLVEGGLFSITAGSGFLSNVYYHDSAIVLFAFYESVASTVIARDVVMTRTLTDVVAFTMCIAGTQCQWFNVSITDSTDPNIPRARSFVLLWSGIMGFSTVRNSYFHNIGRSEPCMAVTEGGIIHVYDSTFVELDNNDGFDSMSDGFVLFDNVVFIRPNLNMLFRCGMTKTCFQLSRIQIVGESRVSMLLYADGGQTSVTDSQFEMMPDSVFRVLNGDLVVRNVTVKNQNGFVCRECMNVRISFYDFALDNAQNSMMFQFSYSTVIFQRLSVRNIVAEKFLTLDFSTLSITDAVFTDMLVDSFGGFVTAASSSISLNSTHSIVLHSTLSIRIGLIYLESSSIEILSSDFRNFNSTLIYAVQSPVSISQSVFTDGGLFDSDPHKVVLSYGGVLWSDHSPIVTITNSHFYNLSADIGGVLYLIGSGVETCSIQGSFAQSNWARRNGGFLYSDRFNVSIVQSNFENNTAQQGGALWVLGSDGELLTQVSNSRFYNNSAGLDGGALMHVHSGCGIDYCDWINNTAEYGPNFASELSGLSVVNSDTHQVETNLTIDAVSGQTYEGKILVGCVDELRQIMVTDNSSKLSIYTAETNSGIIGTTLLDSKKGIFTVSNIKIVGLPESQVSIYGALSSNFTQLLFTAQLRKCIRGEFYNEFQCKLCTHNTYSFDPSVACKLCPSDADCPSGFNMNLHEGRWRSSIYTDDIYQCLIPELCNGGMHSDCADGHLGVMCSECDDNYFKVNQLQCATCKSKGVSAVKGIFTLAVAINSVIYALSLHRNYLMVHAVIFDYFQVMRILVNYNIFWPESLSYLYTVAGDIGSLGLTAFTDPCLGSISHITTTYSQLIVSLLYFVLFCVFVGGASFVFKQLYQKIKYQIIFKFVVYLAYLMLPMIFIRVLQMFPCYNIGDKLYLIYNSSVECWSTEHYAYTLGISLPIFMITAAAPFVLLLGILKNFKSIFLRMPQWEFFCFSVFLMRKYALTCILLFSNSLALPTQVSFVLIFNIATEIIMYQRTDCQGLFFFGLYQSTLISSTLFSFFVIIYWASTSKVTDKETAFILVNYSCLLIPLGYSLSYIVYNRMKKDKRYVVPIDENSVLERHNTLNAGSIMVEFDLNGSNAPLNAPNSSPVSF